MSTESTITGGQDISIATHVWRCQSSFKDLLSSATLEGGAAISWNDEYGRFRVWSQNIGAHKTGTSSLDFRLRNVSDIKLQILRTLEDLHTALAGTLSELLEYQPTALGKSLSAEEKRPELAGDCQVDAVSDEDSLEEKLITSILDGDSRSMLDVLYADVKDSINGLYRMSILLRNPSRRNQVLRRVYPEIAAYRVFDTDHVKSKYPTMAPWLSTRLGEAITLRRGNLKYWQMHHVKLAQGFDHDAKDDDVQSDTIATTINRQSQSEDIVINKHMSLGAASTMSYAPSLLAGSSSKIPPRPIEADGDDAFECPLCHFLIFAPTTKSWVKHVFADLEPYICLFQTCQSPKKLYPSRNHWFQHLIQGHHDCFVVDPHTGVSGEGINLTCPFCQQLIHGRNEIRRHCARHLEALACFAVPLRLLEGPEAGENAEDSGSQGEEMISYGDEVPLATVSDKIYEEGLCSYRPCGASTKDVPTIRGGKVCPRCLRFSLVTLTDVPAPTVIPDNPRASKSKAEAPSPRDPEDESESKVSLVTLMGENERLRGELAKLRTENESLWAPSAAESTSPTPLVDKPDEVVEPLGISPSFTLQGGNERLRRESTKVATENEILRATSIAESNLPTPFMEEPVDLVSPLDFVPPPQLFFPYHPPDDEFRPIEADIDLLAEPITKSSIQEDAADEDPMLKQNQHRINLDDDSSENRARPNPEPRGDLDVSNGNYMFYRITKRGEDWSRYVQRRIQAALGHLENLAKGGKGGDGPVLDQLNRMDHLRREMLDEVVRRANDQEKGEYRWEIAYIKSKTALARGYKLDILAMDIILARTVMGGSASKSVSEIERKINNDEQIVSPLSMGPEESVFFYPPPRPAAGPRRRNDIACKFCLELKVRCSGYDTSPDGRCQNCVHYNQQCLTDHIPLPSWLRSG